LLIGSSDFTHYEENGFAHRQDLALIEPILKLDVDEFYKILYERKVVHIPLGESVSSIPMCRIVSFSNNILLLFIHF